MNGQPLGLLLCCGFGGAGLCLMLRSHKERSRNWWIGLTLLSGAATAGMISWADSLLKHITLSFPAVLLIVTAAIAVSSHDRKRGALWFILASVLNSTLLLLQGTIFAALANAIVVSGSIGLLFLIAAITFRGAPHSTEPMKIPLVLSACLTGALLTMSFIFAISSADFEKSTDPQQTGQATLTSLESLPEIGLSLFSEHGISVVVMGLLSIVCTVAMVKFTQTKAEGLPS